MSAELHDLRLARKRSPIPIPESACRVISVLGGEQPLTIVDVSLSLRRCKEGVNMFLSVPTSTGAFTWNLSYSEGVWPASFAEARKWAQAYAARHGQTFHEVIKERTKVPTGEDRYLLKAGGCREAWLRSNVDALFGEAAVRCQHAGAYCISDGYCHLGSCDMIMDPAPAPDSEELQR